MGTTTLIYLLLFFGLIFRSLAQNPIYGLYAYTLTIYMYAPGSWWGSSLPDLRWSMLSALVTLVSIMIHHQRLKAQLREQGQDVLEGSWLDSGVVKLFIAFVIWVWLQSFWAINPTAHSEFRVMVTKFLLLIYLVHKSVLTSQHMATLLIAHLIGCTYFGYIGLTQHSGGRFESVPTPGMNGGNHLAMHIAPFLIASCYLLLSDWSNKKYLLAPLIVVSLNAIFLTQSRGAMVGLAAAACSSIFLIPRAKRALFISFAVMGLIGGLYLMGEELTDRIKSTLSDPETGQVEASAESRFVIIDAQLRMFEKTPVQGHGHRGTLTLSPYYIDDQYLTSASDSRVRASHNLTMTLLVDHGLIGILLYYGVAIAIFWFAFKHRKYLVASKRLESLLFIACVIAVIDLLIASQFSNSIRLEIGVWFFALCSVLMRMVTQTRTQALERSAEHDNIPMAVK